MKTLKLFYRPDGQLNSTTRRQIELRNLMAHDPHCCACGRKLTLEKQRDNTAHLVRHNLSCPAHEKAVRKLGKHGLDDALVVLTERGREYLESHRPDPNQPQPADREFWIVDGHDFDDFAEAEAYAVELARLLGVKMYIYEGNESRRGMKISQIVRPGDDAAIGDASYFRGRAKLTEFSRLKVSGQ